MQISTDGIDFQCETYTRLAKESIALEETDGGNVDLDRLMENDNGEDKIFAAMGVAKTIGTVGAVVLAMRAETLTAFMTRS